MWLKSITLRGFLSYKDATTIQFSPKFNVIVGPNGSGKSSLLAAMRFILGDAPGDKATYLHQGGSTRVLVGFVSAVFDNTDGVLADMAGSSEVVLRRDFGLKKNEYSLNGKKITKRELQTVLETAGFSQNNPYYFVQQHEIASLSRMSNEERYVLLKDVAGIKVYEDRRLEAAENLERTRRDRAQVNETLTVIDERIKELKKEQTELEHVLALEKERSAVERCLSIKQLDELVAEWEVTQRRLAELRAETNDAEVKLQSLTAALEANAAERAELNRVLAESEGKLKSVEDTHHSQTREEVKLQLELDALKKEIAKRQKLMSSRRRDIDSLEQRRDVLEKDLGSLKSILAEKKRAFRCADTSLVQQKQDRSQLLQKTNRKQQFRSVKDRNKALTGELQERQARLELINKELNQAVSDLEEVKSSLHRNDVEEIRLTRDELQKQLQVLSVDNLRQSIASLTQRERETVDSIARLTRERVEVDGAMRNAKRRIDRTVRPSQLTANNEAMLWAERTNRTEEAVFGTLLSNIRVAPIHHTAVETAGGAQLFNLLVRNRTVAIELIEHLKRVISGNPASAVIVPLDDVKDREFVPPYPPTTPSVRPLVDVIQCVPFVKPAIIQVFGRYLLVDDIQSGKEFISKGFDCITLEGDVFSRKAQEKVTRLNQTLEELESSLKDCESELTAKRAELASTEVHRRSLQQRISLSAEQLKEAMRDAVRATATETRLEALCAQLTSERDCLNEDIERIRREMATPTLGELSAAESSRLEELSTVIEDKEKQLEQLRAELLKAENEVFAKTTELNDVVLKRLLDLESKITEDQTASVDDQEDISRLEEGLRAIQTNLLQTENLVKEMASKRDRARERIQTLESSRPRQLQEKAELETKKMQLDSNLSDVEKKASALKLRRESLMVSASSLAVDPRKAEDYKHLSLDQLTLKLATITRELKQTPEVNRKALDEFTSFRDDQQRLLQECERLEKAEEAVVQLMQRLDEQLESTLLKTFEHVNANFGEVFGEIVGQGHGHLVLKKRKVPEVLPALSAPSTQDTSDGASVTTEASKTTSRIYGEKMVVQYLQVPAAVDPFVGLDLKVAFSSFKGSLPLEALSGGQKSVTALALMLALQRVDSAPFYILDEADAALDTAYRASVAALIKRQAEKKQFIVISHKLQTVQAADYHLRTAIRNQVSIVEPISVELAIKTSQRENQLMLRARDSSNDENAIQPA